METATRTHAGGNTWHLGASPAVGGAVDGGAWGPDSREIVAVGPGGIAYSIDDAASWQALSNTPHWAVDFAPDRVGWAVGPEGRITQLTPLPTPPETRRTGQALEPTIITPDELLQRLNAEDELLVLDVRTAAEFAAGHVPGAINIPHTEIADRLAEVRKAGDVDIVVYCRSGRRAGIAEQILGRADIGRLFDLQGHMSGWLERKLPVERGGARKPPGGGF